MLDFIFKNWPSILILIAGIMISFSTYVENKRTEKLQNEIFELGVSNRRLSEQLISLNEVSRVLTEQIKSIAEHNVHISNQSKQIVEESGKVINKSNELIEFIHKEAEYEKKTSTFSGVLDFTINKAEIKKEKIKVSIGDIYLEHSGNEFRFNDPFYANKISWYVRNGKFILNVSYYDLDGTFLFEIVENVWRVNPIFKGRFNYDDKGFEVLDEKDNVLFNVNVYSDELVKIQGLYIESEKLYTVIGGNKIEAFPNIDLLMNLNYWKVRRDLFKLFVYSGDNWLHKRK